MRGMRSENQELALRIEIVEYHADLHNLRVNFLSGMGHLVIGFALADELYDYLARTTPDLLVLDLKLPGEDGYNIAKRMRTTHPDTYILMLTAHANAEERIRGYVSGADIYLSKPVSEPELALVVNNIRPRLGHARGHAVPPASKPHAPSFPGQQAR